MKENNREYSRLQYRIAKNMDGTVSSPKIWLMTKTLHKICQIHPYEEFSVTAKFNEANTCSLTIYQTNNGIELPYWDRIKDLSVILVEGFGLFEIRVSVTENETAAKKITGQSLQECELGQILGSWEVNTADDIENKKNYQNTATVFYRDYSGSMNEKEEEERLNTSLIHRILSYAPHYEIGHIDESLWDINREFSASNTSIYDFLQTVSNEVGCIFLFDPFSRTVNAFDIEDHCTNPSCDDKRHIFGGVCQGCQSSEYIEKGYGKDITTYIDTSNIAAELEDTVNADGIKNCIQVAGGDDTITNQIGQRLIGNSSCIWTFSDEQIAEMSQPLQEKWKGYADHIAAYQEEFNGYWDEYNQVLKDKLHEESGKMPYIEINSPMNQYQTDNQSEICEGIYNTITSQITYASIGYKSTTLNTLSKNILSYAKLLLPPGYQVEFQKKDGNDDVKCDRGEDSAITKWHGKLYVYLLDAVDEKTGENKYYYSPTDYWKLSVEPGYKVLDKNEKGEDCFSHSYYKWMRQQLDLQLQDNNKNRFQPKYDSDYGDDVSNPSGQPDYYTKYFSAYGRNRLMSFDDAYTKCSIMMEEMAQQYGQSLVQKNFHYILEDGSESSKSMFDQLMEKYRAFKDYLAILIEESQLKIDAYQKRMDELKEKIGEINRICSPEIYFGDLYKELMMFKREDVYENSNFTSEVPDEDLMDTIEHLILNAKQEAAKSCQSNHNVTLSLGNILSANTFSDQIDHISLGNYIRTRIQGTLAKMRIIEMSYHFDNMESSEITFSDAIVGYQPIKEVRDKLDKAASMATSFDFVARQSTRNDKQVNKFNEMFHDGLNAANTLIKSNDREEFVIDNYGILGRQWDRDADMYNDCQLRITHNIIGYTEDNWNTLSMAIGKIIWNNEPLYGVIADALIGRMLIGETLEISNENNTYTMDGMGFRIQNGKNKIEMNAEKAEFTIEKDGEKMFSYSPDSKDGLYINGTGKFTGEINVNDKFIVSANGDVTLPENAAITWSQVTDANNQVTKITKDTINAPYINSLNVKAGSVDAENITGQTISGKILSGGSILIGNNFSVNPLGYMECSGGKFSGSIKSNNGEIGGWHIGTDGMYSNGAYYFTTISDYDEFEINGYPFQTTIHNGKIICGVKKNNTTLSVPDTSCGYVDMSAVGIYAKAKGHNDYLMYVDTQKGDVSFGSNANVNINHALYINGGTACQNAIRPQTDSGTSCGTSNYKWTQIFADKESITTSDRTKKKNIVPISSIYEKLWMELEPVTYEFINGDRKHWGFISQDIESLIKKHGLSSLDVGLFCKDITKKFDDNSGKEQIVYDNHGNPEYSYALRYSELIALNTHMLQKAYNRIEMLEKKIKILSSE